MADSALTNIRNAIKFGLTKIDGTGDYNLDIKEVGDPPKDIENMSGKLPFVNLDFGPEDNLNKLAGEHFQVGANEALLSNRFIFTLDWFMKSANDTRILQEQALADSQRYFGNNYYVPDSGGTRTVFNCLYDGSEPFGLERNQPNCGISVRFIVWYRILLTDPTSLQ